MPARRVVDILKRDGAVWKAFPAMQLWKMANACMHGWFCYGSQLDRAWLDGVWDELRAGARAQEEFFAGVKVPVKRAALLEEASDLADDREPGATEIMQQQQGAGQSMTDAHILAVLSGKFSFPVTDFIRMFMLMYVTTL